MHALHGCRYVEVDESNGVHLFYYFVESEKDPVRDPLVVWMQGGPGCSGLSGLVYEIGKLTVRYLTCFRQCLNTTT